MSWKKEFDNMTVELSADKKTAVIRLDLTKSLGLSSTGKSEKVATTAGNREIGDTGIMLGVNAYKPV